MASLDAVNVDNFVIGGGVIGFLTVGKDGAKEEGLVTVVGIFLI